VQANAFANQYAICETEKNIKLYILPENSGDNRPIFVEGRSSLSVSAISIDKYVKERKLTKVDFIKIDIQGGEDAALEGCKETLRRDRSVIMLEFSPQLITDNGNSLKRRLITLIDDYQMSLFIVENNQLKMITMNDLHDHYDGNIFVAASDSWLLYS